MELTDLAYKLLTKGKNFASVATVMSDGSPQVSAVWIDSDGENIILNTFEGSLKSKNLRRDERVAVSIYNEENPYQQVMIQGKVVEDTQDGAEEHIDKMSKKYLGLDEYPDRNSERPRVIFKIFPEKIFEIDVEF